MIDTRLEATNKTSCQKNSENFFIIPLISLSIVALSFLLQGHIGLSLQDEGFLWYGAFRTWLNDIPIRDFQSYDPGRYYWVALCMKGLGTGLMPLRISLAGFQFLGLTCGLLALSRVVHSRFLITITGFSLLLWMYPRHKLFEHSLAMVLVYTGMLLIEQPTIKRHFASGCLVGLAAFFGRNHGFYSLMGFLFIILFIWGKCSREHLFKRISIFFAGVILGYVPMLTMIAFVPGFAKSFWESILRLASYGRTNIPLPIPWPWRINFDQQGLLELVHQIIVGSFFLIVPVFFVVSLLYTLKISKQRVRESALFISSCCIGVMYMHYAFSRADINHLAQSLHPFLLGIISLPLCKPDVRDIFRKSIVFVVLVVSLFSIGFVSPFYKWISNPGGFVKLVIDSDELLVKKETAQIITTIEKINSDLVREEEQFLIAPHWPTLYPILKRKSPLWESYFLHLRPSAMQHDMINQLKIQNTNWIILGDVPLDGRDELRFRNTHRLIWEYINAEYEMYPVSGLPDNYVLLRKK